MKPMGINGMEWCCDSTHHRMQCMSMDALLKLCAAHSVMRCDAVWCVQRMYGGVTRKAWQHLRIPLKPTSDHR